MDRGACLLTIGCSCSCVLHFSVQELKDAIVRFAENAELMDLFQAGLEGRLDLPEMWDAISHIQLNSQQ